NGQARWVLLGADQGEPELAKAVFAAEAGKADDTKLEALLQLTNLANETGKFDVARERLQRVSSSLARFRTRWELKVRALASEALLDSRQNRYDRALEVATAARKLAEEHTEHPTYAYALLVEASILNSSGRAAQALDSFKKSLTYHEALGERRIEVAATLQSMATAELMLGRPDDAIQSVKRAIPINEAIYGPD